MNFEELKPRPINGIVASGELHILIECDCEDGCNACSLNKECFLEDTKLCEIAGFKLNGRGHFVKRGELQEVRLFQQNPNLN